MTLSSVHQVRSYQINIFFRILGQRANSCHPRPNRRLSDCRACLYRTFYGGFKIGWSGSWLKDHSGAPVSVSNSLQKGASRLYRKQSSVQSFLVQSWILSNWRGQRVGWKNNSQFFICLTVKKWNFFNGEVYDILECFGTC